MTRLVFLLAVIAAAARLSVSCWVHRPRARHHRRRIHARAVTQSRARCGRRLVRPRSSKETQPQIHAGPNQHAAPIASVAKVMTAYLVLLDHPLQLGEEGPTITLTDADVADTDRRRGQEESIVSVADGEQLTELQALQALLAAVGEQHRSGSGALGRRFGGAVRRPDECCRAVTGYGPHPLHGSERLRRRNRVDSGRPGAHRRAGDASAGIREHRRHPERDAAGRRHRAQHRHVARVRRVRRCQDRLGRRGRRLLRLPGDPLDRWKRTTITGVVLGQPGRDQIDAGLAAADAMVDRIAGGLPMSRPPRSGP